MADTSETSICNMALGELGQPPITSLTQQGKTAALCNQWYDATRRELMASAPWSCCKRWATGVMMATDPMPPWQFAYVYPSDALRIHRIKRDFASEPEQAFEISLQAASDTKQINTNHATPTFVYSVDMEDPSRFDQDFVSALSKLLASKMCMLLTKNAKLKADLERSAMAAASVALAATFNEEAEDTDVEPFYHVVR